MEKIISIIDWINFKTPFEAVWKILLISFIIKAIIIIKGIYRTSMDR